MLKWAVIVSAVIASVLIWGGLIVQLIRHQSFQGTAGNVYVAVVVTVAALALALDIVYSVSERRMLIRKRKRFDNPS